MEKILIIGMPTATASFIAHLQNEIKNNIIDVKFENKILKAANKELTIEVKNSKISNIKNEAHRFDRVIYVYDQYSFRAETINAICDAKKDNCIELDLVEDVEEKGISPLNVLLNPEEFLKKTTAKSHSPLIQHSHFSRETLTSSAPSVLVSSTKKEEFKVYFSRK